MPDEQRFHLAIGSRFENIELVQVVLKDCLQRMGMDEDTQHWVDVAVREALANAIKHGNEQNPSKQVHVDLVLAEAELVIQVEDEGVGFEPSRLEDPLSPENLLRPNGRGIFYMKNFMDDIQYGEGPGGGTMVTMRKRVPGPQTEPRHDDQARRPEGGELK
jgi:serine/threonine-protein kinase RsbW